MSDLLFVIRESLHSGSACWLSTGRRIAVWDIALVGRPNCQHLNTLTRARALDVS